MDELAAAVLARCNDDFLGPQPEKTDIKAPRDWESRLARTEEGETKVCLHNIELIVRDDHEFSVGRLQRLEQCAVLMHEPARSRKKVIDGKPIRTLKARSG